MFVTIYLRLLLLPAKIIAMRMKMFRTSKYTEIALKNKIINVGTIVAEKL